MFQQYLEHFQRLLLDPDSYARLAHLARLERDLIGSEPGDEDVQGWIHGEASDGSLAFCPAQSLVKCGRKPFTPDRPAPCSPTWARNRLVAKRLAIRNLRVN